MQAVKFGSIFFSIFFLTCLLSSGQMYQWVDQNGVRHFSNTPPPEDAHVEKLKEADETEYTPPPEKPVIPSDIADSKETRTVTNINDGKRQPLRKTNPSSNPKVVIYTRPGCRYCVLAKNYLNKNSINYTEYNIHDSKTAMQQFKALNGRGVPLIVIGGKTIRGYNPQAIQTALQGSRN